MLAAVQCGSETTAWRRPTKQLIQQSGPLLWAVLAVLLLMSGFVGYAGASESAAERPSLRLWYAAPAEKWTDALPIGNGRMGAMVFGGVPDERIQFNEDTLWKGQPHDYTRAGAGASLGEIRQLV